MAIPRSIIPSDPQSHAAASEPLPRWLPLLILAGTIAVLFYRLLAGEVLFWGLPALQFQPWRTFAINEFRAGRLPLWNPLNGGGEPLLANYQTAYFYPPELLGLLIAPGPQGIGWLGMIHLFWAGLGIWLYTRELGLSPFARGIGALAYALNGAVVARFGTVPMVDAAAWLPWLLFTAERLLRASSLGQRISRTIWFGLAVTMLLLVGHAQWAFYSLLLTGLYVVYRLVLVPIGLEPKRRFLTITAFGIGIVLGVGIAAVQLLPTAELQAQSQRSSGADQSFVLNFSDEWPLFLTQFDPFFFGNPGDGTYMLKGEYFEFASYVGILPVIVALIAVGHCVRKWRRWRPVLTNQLSVAVVPFFAGSVGIGFLLALGKNTPLYLFLYHHVPTFNQFQAPARWLLWAVAGLSVLAAIGASLWQANRPVKQRARLGLIGALGLTLLGAFLTFSRTGGDSAVTLTRGVLTIGMLLALTAAAFVTQPLSDRVIALRRWQIGVLLFVALDLIWANALLNPATTADFYAPHPASATAARTFQSDDAIQNAEFDQFLLVNDYRAAGQRRTDYRAAQFPNMNILDSTPTFNVFEPLRIGGIDRYSTLLDKAPTPGLLRAAAIGTSDNPQAPRVWLVSHLIPTTDPFTAMTDPNWNPAESAFVPIDTAPLNIPASTDNSAQVMDETPQTLTIATHAAQPSALIVADTWYPGWNAWVDNQPTPILQANGAFRAVMVPAGDHRVAMLYQPISLRNGALISGIGSLLVAILALLALILRRNI